MKLRIIWLSDKKFISAGRGQFLGEFLRVKLPHSCSQIHKRYSLYKVTILTSISACLYEGLRNSPENSVEPLILAVHIS